MQSLSFDSRVSHSVFAFYIMPPVYCCVILSISGDV